MMNRQMLIVTVKQTKQTHVLMQQLKAHHIPIRNVRFQKQALLFEMDVFYLTTLRKIRKRHRVKLTMRYKNEAHILKRNGVTFIGMLLLLVIPFLLSQFIWQVTVEADAIELEDRMTRFLQQELMLELPIYKGRFLSDNVLRQQMMTQFRELSWIHITKRGSQVKLSPQVAPKKNVPTKQAPPQHLIASNNGVITHFAIERGIRKVAPNMTVYKGDTLVSGVLERDDQIFVIGAEGDVFADYWLETTFSIPQTIQMQVLEDVQLNMSIQWQQFKSSWQQRSLAPLKQLFLKEEQLIMRSKVQTLHENDIEKIILPLLHEKMIRSLPPKSTIKSEKLLHVYADDDTVKGKVLYLVNENIATPHPINRGE